MKNRNRLTISIGTSAYNEEQNIINMLKSVISQKEMTVKIVEIIVVSDGSSDRTVELAKKIKNKKIRIVDEKKRLGKATRVNQLLKMFGSDVLVFIDADMIMKNKNTIENIGRNFIEDKTAAFVCGNTEPLPARTFLESSINNYIYARDCLGNEFNFVDTAYGARGFMAFSKKFAKSLNIPNQILNEDAYSYFACISRGFRYYYAKDAIALYRSPGTIEDYINQSVRHIAGGVQLYEYFGQEEVKAGFAVPKNVLTKLMFLQLKKNPIKYLVSKILNCYSIYLSRRKSFLNPKWKTIESSKRLL